MSKNILNEYTEILPAGMLDNTPKAVFAAMLVSEYLNRLNIKPENIGQAIMDEWQTLYDNCIVSQRPPNKQINRTLNAG